MQAESTLTFRLSGQQRRFWALAGEDAFCVQGSVTVPHGVKPSDLEQAASRSLQRHEILRTTFRRRPGVRVPFQVISSQGQLRWREVEIEPGGLEKLLDEERSEPFDLGNGPLVRLALIRGVGPRDALVITLPSLCGDPRTLELLAGEILGSTGAGADDLEPLQYGDFTRWQEELLAGEDESTLRGREHWARLDLERIGDLALPGEASPAGSGPFSPRAVRCALGPAVLARLEELTREQRASPASFLLTAWMVLLWRSGAGDDPVVGRLAAGRTLEDLETCLGPIDRVVPVKLPLARGLAFAGLWTAVEEESRAGDRWLELAPQPELWPFLFEAYGSAALLHRFSSGEPFKLKLVTAPGAGGLEIELWHDRRLYEPADAERLAARLRVLLQAALRDPRRPIDELDLLPDEERQRLVHDFHRDVPVEPFGRCVHELFAERAERHPERIAVVSEDGQKTAGALDVWANRLANHLRALGVGPEVRVALFLERSGEAMAALLAVLKAGGAYVPLDPVFPRERIAAMLDQAQAAVVLTRERLLALLPDHPAPRICLDADAEAISGQSPQAPESGVGLDHLAYVLFTSGSTGRPKGVAVEHRNLLSYLSGLRERLALPEGGSYATVSTLAADLGNTAIFPALVGGGTLHVLSREQASNPAALADAFRSLPVDVLKIVPSHLAALLLAQEPRDILPRRVLVLGGEAPGRDLIEQVQAAAPGLAVFNHYGPTETTVGALAWPVPPDLPASLSRVPLGRPLPGARVYLVSPALQPVPAGVVGEICIGGGGVARGYQDAPDQTAERFLPDPFADEPGRRIYRTGDLARFRRDGELEFLGRADGQVKIRGFRIELGEIEAVLHRHPDVWECAVLSYETDGSDPQLVAYVVSRRDRRAEPAALREFLGERLPEYMMPSAFVSLETLPLTSNGKVDRRALPPPGSDRAAARIGGARPKSLVELELAKIWEDLLHVSPIGMDESFFEIGGHSLLAVRMMAQIEKRLGCALPLAALYRCPTIRGLADLLGSEAALGPPAPLVPIQPHGTRPPFFCVHPMGGEVLCYYHLSRALGQDQPFYGLQARGLREPGDRALSIPEMAEQYLAAIREVSPDGPHLLGGYSFGSKVAFEIAHQIRRSGGTVALLALLDGGAPGKTAKLDRIEEAIVVAQALREQAREAGGTFAISFEEIRRRDPEDRIPYVLEQAKLQGRLPDEVDMPVVQQFLSELKRRQEASAAYLPEVYPDPIVYFRTADQDVEFLEVLRESGYEVDDPTKGWSRFAVHPIEVHYVPGVHEMLMHPPNVELLADALRTVINRLHAGKQ